MEPAKRKFSHDQMEKEFFIEPGAEVTCPYCKAHIAFVVKKIEEGKPIESKHFLGPGIHYGAEPKCYRCGGRWLDPIGRIHLRGGWFPKALGK